MTFDIVDFTEEERTFFYRALLELSRKLEAYSKGLTAPPPPAGEKD